MQKFAQQHCGAFFPSSLGGKPNAAPALMERGKDHASLSYDCRSPLDIRFAPAQATHQDQPVRSIVPFLPGGGTDIGARITGKGMQPETGQPSVTEIPYGAGGLVGAEYAAKVAADGYQLLFTIRWTHNGRTWLFNPL